jgi:hypothetical protein
MAIVFSFRNPATLLGIATPMFAWAAGHCGQSLLAEAIGRNPLLH